MARVSVIAAATGLGITAAAALTGSARADQFNGGVEPLSPYYSTLQFVVVGSTDASEKLQWVDDSEARHAAKPDLPVIESDSWLPAGEP